MIQTPEMLELRASRAPLRYCLALVLLFAASISLIAMYFRGEFFHIPAIPVVCAEAAVLLIVAVTNRELVRVTRDEISTRLVPLTIFPARRMPCAEVRAVCFYAATALKRTRPWRNFVAVRRGNGKLFVVAKRFANEEETRKVAASMASWISAACSRQIDCVPLDVQPAGVRAIGTFPLVLTIALLVSLPIGATILGSIGRDRKPRSATAPGVASRQPAPEHSFEGPFSPDKAMVALWGNYDADMESEWDLPTPNSAPSGMLDQLQIVSGTDPPLLYWHLWTLDSVVVKGKTQWHLYMTARPDLDPNERHCHPRRGCDVALGGYVFEERGRRWELVGGNPFIAVVRQYIAMETEGRIVRWGAESIGLLITDGETWMGQSVLNDRLLAWHDGQFRQIFDIETLNDDMGSTAEKGSTRTAKWELGRAGVGGVYDLQLTVDGTGSTPAQGRYLWDGNRYVHETTKDPL